MKDKDFYGAIKELYPNIKDREFILQDDNDGEGVYLKQWTHAQPKPDLKLLQVAAERAAVKRVYERKLKRLKLQTHEKIESFAPSYKQRNILIQALLSNDFTALQILADKIKVEVDKYETAKQALLRELANGLK